MKMRGRLHSWLTMNTESCNQARVRYASTNHKYPGPLGIIRILYHVGINKKL